MTGLPLVYLGAPVLRQIALPITIPDAAEIAALATAMVRTMYRAHGVGLAAPQVGHGVRLIVFCIPAARTEDGEEWPVQILLNPEFTPLTDAMESGLEGCLSLPGLRGMVPRHAHIGYSGLTLDGQRLEREAQGFHARVVQHEIDHLNGIMYPDRMSDAQTLMHESLLLRKGTSDGEAPNQ